MKVALVCSHGGHLTEMLSLIEAFEGIEFFFITYDSQRTQSLPYEKYLIKNIGTNPLKLGFSFIQILFIFLRERPKIVVSTGSEIAIPAFFLGKFIFNCKNVFIESWCRVTSTSVSGRIVYPMSDIFLVQWEQLLTIYGKKAQCFGGII